MATQERRRAVRAPARLAMQVKLSSGDHANVETINVSANGVYFTSDKHIPGADQGGELRSSSPATRPRATK